VLVPVSVWLVVISLLLALVLLVSPPA